MIKTVLVPGAPWPPKSARVYERKRQRHETDINFEAWVKRQKINNIDFYKEKNVIRKP